MSDTYRSFVYRPYYYYFENKPYFESKYIVKNDDIIPESSKPIRTIKLKDGTIIEAFSNGYNIMTILLVALICVGLLYYFVK